MKSSKLFTEQEVTDTDDNREIFYTERDYNPGRATPCVRGDVRHSELSKYSTGLSTGPVNFN